MDVLNFISLSFMALAIVFVLWHVIRDDDEED